jgi:hypothetical protein
MEQYKVYARDALEGLTVQVTMEVLRERVTGFHTVSKEVCKAMLYETGVCKPSVHCILQCEKRKPQRQMG